MAEEKTEAPTPRRLRKAREQGDVPVSSVLSQAVGFVAALALLPGACLAAASTIAELLRSAIQGRALLPGEIARVVLVLTLPIVAAAAFGAVALSVAQSGGNVSFGRILPNLSRLDVVQGLRGLFAGQRLFGVVRALVGAAVCVALVLVVLRAMLPSLAHTAGELNPALAVGAASARRLLWWVAGLGLAIGLLDWVVTHRAWRKRWMMSPSEVKREYRENEGDPELKAARRRAHQEALLTNTLYAVKDASVVIVNPTHLACALRYDEAEDAAPRVVAQGQGDIARRIVEAAHHYGVPVVRDVPVARALSELEIGDEIPEALYEAVAEILRELWEGEQRS